VQLPKNKFVYFASDFHLGAPDAKSSLLRERKVVNWLSDIKPNCAALYLMGDIFDFWYDYGAVVLAGYTRLLGKLAEFTDADIPVYYFTGNHDMWMFNYLKDELNITILRKAMNLTINNKQFHIAHGDGLGPGDGAYKLLKQVFSNKICQWLFGWLHPRIGIWLANSWSLSGNQQYKGQTHSFKKEEEWLVQYARQKLNNNNFDYFIFGHRHTPVIYALNKNSTYINLGDWINHFTYAKFNGKTVELLQYT